MKVIIVSDVLEEPFEIDSEKGPGVSPFMFSESVAEKIKAVLQTERMRAEAHEHGILGR